MGRMVCSQLWDAWKKIFIDNYCDLKNYEFSLNCLAILLNFPSDFLLIGAGTWKMSGIKWVSWQLV